MALANGTIKRLFLKKNSLFLAAFFYKNYQLLVTNYNILSLLTQGF